MSTTDEKTMREQLVDLRREKRGALVAFIDARQALRSEFEAREASDAKPTDEERAAFDAAETAYEEELGQRSKEIDRLAVRIKEERTREQAAADAAKAAEREARAAERVEVTYEPLTYREDNQRVASYFQDLALVDPAFPTLNGSPEAISARGRLERHRSELEVELPKRAKAREQRAMKQVEEAERSFRSSLGMQQRGLEASPFEKRVNPNRTDGQGGFFVPPLWLIDQYIRGLRAGRVAAGLCKQMDLPEGTDSINIPKLSTLTQVGVQGSDNTGVTSQDFTDTSVQANVKTLAGQEDVAIQLLDQSPGHILDQVLMEDLTADYNRLVDRQVVFGNGAGASSLNGGQLLGIYPFTNWSGTNVVTYTTGSPAPWHFLSVAGAMWSNVAENRFDVSNFHYLLHPRRAAWFFTGVDGNNRPLVESSSFGPWNVAALEQANLPFEGLAGKMPFGPNVYMDANVPTTDTGSDASGGSNDVAIGAKWDDLWLFEGDLRTRVLPEILSGTLQVRYQIYNYVAFLVRYGQSIAGAVGTGFSAPTGAVSSITF